MANDTARQADATRPPRVSIGLPVHNGSRYLEAAVASITAHAFEDLELINRDNASTDDSADIARSLAVRDPRIRLEHAPGNEGAAANFNAVFRLARGEYFKWAAHDDLMSPTFVEACLQRLEADRRAVLCHSQSARIDEDGRAGGRYEEELDLRQEDPCERFRAIIHSSHACFSVFGLVRSRTLGRTPLIGAWLGSDRNLLAELALIGKLRLVDEPLFQRRDHAEASIRKHATDRDRLAWFDPRPAADTLMPTLKRIREYESSIHRVALSERDRAGCLEALAAWCREGRLHTGEAVAERLHAERAARRRTSADAKTADNKQENMTP